MEESRSPISGRLGCAYIGLAALTVFAHWEGGSTTQWHFGNWWGGLWLGPAIAACLVSAATVRQRTLLALLPLIVFAAAWTFEVQFGRTTLFPWWLSHMALAASLLSLLLLRMRRPRTRLDTSPALLLVAFAALSPWFHPTPAGSFWAHCNRLRVGMDPGQVSNHMEPYILHGINEYFAGQGPDFPNAPQGSQEYSMMYLHEEDVADHFYALFLDGELRRLLLSPD